MTDLTLDATSRTPTVTLRVATSRLVIAGESYPEDVTGFFTPISRAIDHYFESGQRRLDVEIRLIYFNSSSARALTNLLDSLETRAAAGAIVTIDWYCDDDDDITREFAEDIGDDLEHIRLTVRAMKRDG